MNIQFLFLFFLHELLGYTSEVFKLIKYNDSAVKEKGNPMKSGK